MKKLFAFLLRLFQVVPNLCWVFLAYLAVGVDHANSHAFTVIEIPLTWGGVLILAGAVMLAFEVMKSTAFTEWALFELVMSIGGLLCGVFLILKIPFFQTELFLIITAFQCVDVIVGTVVMVSVARRDIGLVGR